MKHFHGRHERGEDRHFARVPHEGGGPGRFFGSSDLRYVILYLISDAPRHGYEIIKLIEGRTSGAHSPSPGIVYPTLTLLEEMGLAAVTVEGTRKLYAITDEGRRELEAHRAGTEAVLQRMQQAGERHTRERPGSLLRAMENLKMVLRMRGGQWSPDQLAAATDVIDNAAKQIERL